MGSSGFQFTLLSSLSTLLQRSLLGCRPFASLLALTTAIALGGAAAQAEPAAERYLFGQSAQPDQVGQGYVVLERTGDRVYGALYYPSSSFDCFYGQVEGTELAMTIVNSYDQEAYPYSIAMVDGPVVASSNPSEVLAPFGLSGFHAIDTLSANDHRMLDMCRSTVGPEQ